MYTLIYLILLAFAGIMVFSGLKNKKNAIVTFGIIIAILTFVFFWFLKLWGEKLWFDQTGYPLRFSKEWLSKILLFLSGGLFGCLYVFLFTWKMIRKNRILLLASATAAILISGFWWFDQWETVLVFKNAAKTGIVEPILGIDTGFYFFSLPFYKSVYTVLLYLAVVVIVINLIAGFSLTEDKKSFQIRDDFLAIKNSFVNIAALLIIIAAGRYLHRFDLMYSGYGVVNGPGWTDANIRLPMLLLTSILTLAAAILLLFPAFRRYISRIYNIEGPLKPLTSAVNTIGVLIGLWILFSGLVPWLFQWLKVEPNEITVERPYIEHNIKFTRIGFDLEKVEENEYPANDVFNSGVIEENRNIFSNIRLWDYRALDAVFKQFQEIRLYYEFNDVDIDRYRLDNKYSQVMVSAREMKTDNLPANSQTFVNKRFKYTHGYGSVLTRVNEFTPEGLPNLIIKDIPPVSIYPDLNIEQPGIYYGELTRDHVIVNSSEEEFDYPSGENNIYTSYEGPGGVQISNLFRKFLFGWKFDGTRLLLSSYPNRESRIMMHRNIIDRAKSLAPFLNYDDDPYIVISEGKLYWILDAYTTSQYMPYSEKFSSFENIPIDINESEGNIQSQVGGYLQGKNYIRNSVKAVINAYTGKVDFYIFDSEDPLVNVYAAVFPGLFKAKSEMPSPLYDHIRYPADMLLVQGIVYAKYHMTDPTVFYNQEDLWVRSTEKYYNNVQPVEPYYIMWEQPGSDELEFVLMLPFTPKNKQVMIAWLAGLCDGEDYGRFLAYKFPKEKRILGTQQVETKIDQDSYLSGQLTLWDQRGSNVIRGNVLAIPVSNTMLYVEPIYLQSETAAYPELRLVAIMHNDILSYAPDFEAALRGLLKEGTEQLMESSTELSGKENIDELIKKANSAFNNYLQQMNNKQFIEAGSSLEELQKILDELTDRSGEQD